MYHSNTSDTQKISNKKQQSRTHALGAKKHNEKLEKNTKNRTDASYALEQAFDVQRLPPSPPPAPPLPKVFTVGVPFSADAPRLGMYDAHVKGTCCP